MFSGDNYVISDYDLKRLVELIADGKADLFYSWTAWLHKRDEVFKLDNYECQYCKAKGKYTRAEIVHHIKHLKERPDLALSIFDGEERQLISCCKLCHEEQHPERFKSLRKSKKLFWTEERWD